MATKTTNQQIAKSPNQQRKRIKRGLALHVHHSNFLFEYCYDYDGRRKDIRLYKPKAEQSTRLRLFKLVPLRLLPPDLRETVRILNKQHNAFERASAEELHRAKAELLKAYIKIARLIKRHERYLETLHSKICKDCSWDGKTIFPYRSESTSSRV